MRQLVYLFTFWKKEYGNNSQIGNLILHLTHSTNLATGGVAEATVRLNSCLEEKNCNSEITEDAQFKFQNANIIIAHGLWQWPGYKAWENFRKTGVPYLVFPHGMLDPWFKKTYPFKHLKKQCYWWWRLVSEKINS